MNDNFHGTTEDAWLEWRRVCAADLCCDATATMLRRFGASRFYAYMNKVETHSGRGMRRSLLYDVNNAWHLLETHAAIGKTRSGKRYKDWLFDRVGPEVESRIRAIEGGATLLMRDVVRQYLRRERGPAFMTSLETKYTEANASYSLDEWLPGQVNPLNDMAQREWQEIAWHHARDYYSRLESSERIILWARFNGFSLNDERIARWTKTSASLLYKKHLALIDDLGAWIKNKHPDESSAALLHMCRLMLDNLAELITENIYKEKRAVRFFKKL
ncbi:MAG TPA: hypothetical protein PJ991_03480 [Kiritimatiellia bacterium]|nr:hypothetical protein [Kiritimatiellia bacterium]